MTTSKVFAIGFNKSATTSLHTLFQSLGLTSYHGGEWRDCEDMSLLNNFDCFSDGYPKNHNKLDALFPGSKFILQVRDLKSWVYSRLAHIRRVKALNTYKGSAIWDETEHAVKFWIQQRNDYHLEVMSYFENRPADFLIVNVTKDQRSAQKIVDFLGFTGNYTMPYANANPGKEVPEKDRVLFGHCLQALGIAEHEQTYDIYCPSLVNSLFPSDSGKLVSSVRGGMMSNTDDLSRYKGSNANE